MPIPLWLMYPIAAAAAVVNFTTSSATTVEIVDAEPVAGVGASAGAWWFKFKKVELSKKYKISRVHKAIQRVHRESILSKLPERKGVIIQKMTKLSILRNITKSPMTKCGFEDMHNLVGDVHVSSHVHTYAYRSEHEHEHEHEHGHGREHGHEHEHEHEERKRTRSAMARTAKWSQR